MAGTIRKREQPPQRLTLTDKRQPKRVDSIQFIAHVNPSTIRFDKHNALLITLVVPAEFAEDALDLRYMSGVPLSVDVQKWKIVPQESPYRIISVKPGDGAGGNGRG